MIGRAAGNPLYEDRATIKTAPYGFSVLKPCMYLGKHYGPGETITSDHDLISELGRNNYVNLTELWDTLRPAWRPF